MTPVSTVASHFNRRKDLILELGFRQEALPLLLGYIEHLWATNDELNLISRKMTIEELIDNHLIDCLLPLKHFPEVKTAADFGSGGGLPGVVYAIHFSKIQYRLFEKSKLKQNFLKGCQKFAPNLQVHAEIPKDLKGIDIVTARAFKPIDVILDVSRTYYEDSGKYFLLKARKQKIDEEMQLAHKKFKNIKFEVIPLKTSLLDVERHLVTINF